MAEAAAPGAGAAPRVGAAVHKGTACPHAMAAKIASRALAAKCQIRRQWPTRRLPRPLACLTPPPLARRLPPFVCPSQQEQMQRLQGLVAANLTQCWMQAWRARRRRARHCMCDLLLSKGGRGAARRPCLCCWQRLRAAKHRSLGGRARSARLGARGECVAIAGGVPSARGGRGTAVCVPNHWYVCRSCQALNL